MSPHSVWSSSLDLHTARPQGVVSALVAAAVFVLPCAGCQTQSEPTAPEDTRMGDLADTEDADLAHDLVDDMHAPDTRVAPDLELDATAPDDGLDTLESHEVDIAFDTTPTPEDTLVADTEPGDTSDVQTPSWDPVALGLPSWVREGDPLAGGEPCTDEQRRLVAPFLAPEDIQYVIPIGWVANTPGHILPAEHQIVVQQDQVSPRPVTAAQSGVVFAFQVSLHDADDPLGPTAIDAFIDVRVCRGFSYRYFHVSALSEALSTWVNDKVAMGAAQCDVTIFPEGPGRICRFRAGPSAQDLPALAAGDVVGRLGGVYVAGELVQGSAGMELGVIDLLSPPQVMDATRQGPHRHALCPLEAYPEGALRDAYHARLEAESGETCGTLALSVAGSAAGFWWSDVDAFLDPFDVTDQNEALTLIRAARRPQEQVIATGVTSLGLGDHAFFSARTGSNGARHNPPLETVTSQSGVHCFDGLHTQVNVEATDFALGHFFLALTGPDAIGRPSLLIERVASGPCPDDAGIAAHVFGASAVRFQRPAADEPIP